MSTKNGELNRTGKSGTWGGHLRGPQKNLDKDPSLA